MVRWAHTVYDDTILADERETSSNELAKSLSGPSFVPNLELPETDPCLLILYRFRVDRRGRREELQRTRNNRWSETGNTSQETCGERSRTKWEGEVRGGDKRQQLWAVTGTGVCN